MSGRKLKLGAGIATFAMFLVMLASIMIVAYNYVQGTKLARERTKSYVETVLLRIERQAQALIAPVAPTLNSIVTLSKHTDLRINSGEPLRALSLPLLATNPQISSIYVGHENGDFTQIVSFVGKSDNFRTPYGASAKAGFALVETRAEGDAARGRTVQPLSPKGSFDETPWYESTSYDPRKRPWYEPATKTKGLYRTAPYIFAKSKKPGLTISRALSNTAPGVAGIDLDLRTLKAFLNNLKTTDGTRLAIVTGDNRILAHTHSDGVTVIQNAAKGGNQLNLSTLSGAGDKVLLAMASAADTAGTMKDIVVGENRYLGSAIAMDLGGASPEKLIVAVPWAEVVGPLIDARNRSILIAVAIALAVMGIAFFVSRHIARPVEELTQQALRISNLQLEKDGDAASFISEIDQLGSAMDSMKSALSVFGRYVPRTLVRQLVQTGSGGELGGERRDLVIMFSDIEGFTTIAEQQRPEDMLHQLSDYFESQSSAILENKGTIDKYIGDAVMAFWNAPLPDEQKTRNACLAVLTARERLAKLNDGWEKAGRPVLRTRYGLHCGSVIVGNVGSSERINYTVMGAAANLASRLEGLNKFFGTQLIASETVVETAGPEFLWRPIGRVMPKGVITPIPIYELVGLKESISGLKNVHPQPEADILSIRLWEEAFDAYLARDWANAKSLMSKYRRANKEDLVAPFYLKRVATYVKSPPAQDWSGVEVFESK